MPLKRSLVFLLGTIKVSYILLRSVRDLTFKISNIFDALIIQTIVLASNSNFTKK